MFGGLFMATESLKPLSYEHHSRFDTKYFYKTKNKYRVMFEAAPMWIYSHHNWQL